MRMFRACDQKSKLTLFDATLLIFTCELFWQHRSEKNNHDVDSDGLNQIICTYIWSKDLSFFYFYGNPKGTSVNSGKRTKK